MSIEQLEIQKRLSLNWLIQGAAQHAGMTFHHLIGEELNALSPKLLRLYDQFALINLLQYWQAEVVIMIGSPTRFWNNARVKPSHPFFGHPLLAKYGGILADQSRRRALKRCNEKGMTRIPLAFSFQTLFVVERLRQLEAAHRERLIQLGKETASQVWGIPINRLDAELTDKIVLPPDLLPAKTMTGAAMRAGIVGLGAVARRRGELVVVAKATNWQLLAKELVKGTAELICLHGLNHLDDEMYKRVLAVTDQIDLEPWMLQTGGELWRRLLQFVPDGYPMARMLMHLARLPAGELETILANVIEENETAATCLSRLAK
jgi:hypothetical protein